MSPEIKVKIFPEAKTKEGKYEGIGREIYEVKLPAIPQIGTEIILSMYNPNTERSNDCYFKVTEVTISFQEMELIDTYHKNKEYIVYFVVIRTNEPWEKMEECSFPEYWK